MAKSRVKKRRQPFAIFLPGGVRANLRPIWAYTTLQAESFAKREYLGPIPGIYARPLVEVDRPQRPKKPLPEQIEEVSDSPAQLKLF